MTFGRMVGGAAVPGGRGWRGLLPAGAVVVVLLGAAAAGCARNTLGTTSSPCFRALPLGEDAVHDRGSFVGVRLVSAAKLTKLRRLDGLLARRSRTPVHNVCLVGYSGSFRPDQVMLPAGQVPASGVGHFAVVVVSNPQNRLLATLVLAREPVRFRHLALGAPVRGRGPPGVSGTD